PCLTALSLHDALPISGIIGGLPRQNTRTLAEFDEWLATIRRELDEHASHHPDARIGPIAVNLSTRLPRDELRASLEVCGRHGVRSEEHTSELQSRENL